jgi:hypothetical protein
MPGDETQKGERRETVGELFSLLSVAQKMGRRLAYETHGDSYDSVRDLNVLLHQACAIAELIQQTQTTLSEPVEP